MLQTDDPKQLVERAEDLERRAGECEGRGLKLSAAELRRRAKLLREQAARLGTRRTDGIVRM